MKKNKNNLLLVLIVMFLVEFSIIVSGRWMLGHSGQIHFNAWPMSEWLINYQGGFVRRGLIGEIFFQLNPDQPLIPLFNQFTFFLYLFYYLIFLLIYWFGKIRNLSLLTIALLIPGGIFQMGISTSFYTRKEILFLILFGLLCLMYQRIACLDIQKRKAWLISFALLSIFGGVILTLTHEAYLFMGFPYVAILFWVVKKENPENRFFDWAFKVFLLLIPLTFALCVAEHGTAAISQKIWDSLSLLDRLTLSPHAPYTVYGAIMGFGWDKLQNLSTVYGVFVTTGWIYWLFFALANYFVLGYVFGKIGVLIEKPHANQFISLLSIPCAFSLVMFVIAADWGRWIASAGNHAILLGFTLIGSRYATSQRVKAFHLWPQKWIYGTHFIYSKWTFWVIIFYELIFVMPECCVQYPHIFMPYSAIAQAVIR
jgi:hypothetical protein